MQTWEIDLKECIHVVTKERSNIVNRRY